MRGKLKVWIEGNPLILKIVRIVYDNTLLKYYVYKHNEDFKNYNAEILKKLNQAFKELDIEYWLDFGTLLGAIREKGFISHDIDIDIGILGLLDDKERAKISKVLVNYGFERKNSFIYRDKVRQDTYAYKGVPIDLFYYEKQNKTITGYYFLAEEDKSREKTINDRGGLIPIEVKFPFDGIEKHTFLNIDTYFPKNAIEYVVARYGENYKEKVVEWDNMRSPNNIKILSEELGYYH